MPWLGCPFDSPLAPRKGGRAGGHRQVSDVGRHHGHFPFHPALLLPTTHPAPIQSDQHRLLSGLDGFGLLPAEAQTRSASACCCAACCWPCRLVSRRISSALICAPLSLFNVALAARYGHEQPANSAASCKGAVTVPPCNSTNRLLAGHQRCPHC